MTLQSRLKHFISSQGLSISAFERECGLSNGFVSKVGDSIRREKLDLISKRFPELNIDWETIRKEICLYKIMRSVRVCAN